MLPEGGKKMSEIKIYNQEMYVSEKDIPAEVLRWARRLIGDEGGFRFWKSGAYNFWTMDDRNELRAAMSAPKPSPPVRKRLGGVPKPSPPLRRKSDNSVKPSPTPRPVRRD